MANSHSIFRKLGLGLAIVAMAVFSTACGGAGGGQGPSGAGQGLVLVSFIQAGIDNIPLNEVLEFRFSEPVNAATINPASIQIRQGNAFGATVKGTFEVSGSTVLFRPQLPGLCDLTDSGFDADTQYRVQVIGWPEEFAVQNTQGQKLAQTTTWEFHTRLDQDPEKFRDQIPGAAPIVLATTPSTGDAAIDTTMGVDGGRQRVILTMSENLDPCSVDLSTVTIEIYERGGPGTFVPAPGTGNASGFVTGGADVSDQNTPDHTTWGSDTGVPWPTGPQTLPATVHLEQDFGATRIIISPLFGQDPANPELGGTFPDNVLLVVRLSFGIEDFGGEPLAPFAMSFTTENNGPTGGLFSMLAEGETPFLPDGTTADVNTARAPSRVQGYLLFAGDGDNGSDVNTPTLPESDGTGCTAPFKGNDGAKDPLDPAGDIVLDSGPANSCINTTDGSSAVIWELLSLRLRSGVTMRMTGTNAAILLIQGDAVIEANATLRARGDGLGGTPTANGGNGHNTNSGTQPTARPGGVGVLGGGDGGDAKAINTGNGNDGVTGEGSPDGFGVLSGHGAGHHNQNARKTSFQSGGGARGGGGGGHSTAGGNGPAIGAGPSMSFQNTGDGLGGAIYPTGSNSNLLLVPSAGSGGGSGGYLTHQSFAGYNSTGGAGGAGGGFLDITSSGDITIFGTLDGSGGRAGVAAAGFYGGSGGGGGGSGGGLRLLTPNDINVNGGTVTTAGGAGGAGAVPTGGGAVSGAGGAGGVGRLVMEDGDSVISGFGAAITIPTEGDDGFFRGVFDASRFQGGGLMPQAITDIIFMGPISPTYIDPVPADFDAGSPLAASPGGVGSLVIQIEARGYRIQPDGGADLGTVTAWQTVGNFLESGVETAPTYVPAAGLVGLSTNEYLQFRITVFLNNSVGPFDPGAFIDTWNINFVSDL